MAKEKRRRKEESRDFGGQQKGLSTENPTDKKLKKSFKKSESDCPAKPKKKSKASKRPTIEDSTPKPARSNGVRLESLQSIFATKDTSDRTFTLFGGDPVLPDTIESLPSAPILVPSLQPPSSSLPTDRKTLYFFPHYESPEKNALSLFPVSEEPFYYQRTEYLP
jgi:hypothetical protein